jgi:Asp-tRNA(Asn)/Glu-tRNA(Gln) amidotransferase C subunit
MESLSKELLQSIADVLARIPIDAADLPSSMAQLGAQLDGLARLDDLDLQNVEPATVLLPPTEAADAR